MALNTLLFLESPIWVYSGSDWHFEHDLRCRRQLVNVIWVSKSDWQIEEFAVFGVSDLDGSDSEW